MERFNAETSAAEIRRVTVLAAVQRSIAQAWLDRWYAARAIQLLAEQTASITPQVEAAETAYHGNRGPHVDIVAARLER